VKTAALIDLKDTRRPAYRETAGTFGSTMDSEGMTGHLISRLKARMINVPVVHLGYISGLLARAGYRVSFYKDCNIRGEQLVIIASSIVCYREEVQAAARIKAQNPGCQVGFTGAFASIKPEIFLEEADFVLAGEAELVLDSALRQGLELEGVISTQGKADCAALPYPDWRPFPVHEYAYWPMLTRKPFLPILASRGCPYSCDYCAYTANSSRYFLRETADVINEIEQLQNTFGLRSLLFRDPCFTASRKATVELLEEILRRGIKLEWACETRTDRLDDDLIRLMARAGCRALNLGVESASTDSLTEVGRKTPAQAQSEAALRSCERHGIKVSAFYIVGFPADTEASILETIRLSQELNTFTAQFCVLTPYPNTVLHERLKDRITAQDWQEFTEYEPVMRLDHLSPDQLRELLDRSFREYYKRPQWFAAHWRSLAEALVEGMVYR